MDPVRARADIVRGLAAAMQRTAIYPVTHPLVRAAVDKLVARIGHALGGGDSVALAVARDRMLVDGKAMPSDHVAVADLARKLYRQQIAGVRIAAGVDADELTSFLATIADETCDGAENRPLGLRGEEALQRWPHLRLAPLTFDQLELVDGGGAAARSSTDQRNGADANIEPADDGLWVGLARAALDDGDTVDPDEIARRLDGSSDQARDHAVAGQLVRIVDQLETTQGPAADALRRRVSRIIRGMRPQTLSRILAIEGDPGARAEFLERATNVLAADAVVDVVQAAASVTGQTISHSFLRLLKKLAAHADVAAGDSREQADGALREQVRELVGSWNLSDPNPDEYTIALESIAAARTATAPGSDQPLVAAERIVQLSLEVGVVGPPTLRALDRMRQQDDPLELLSILTEAPDGPARDELESYVTSPRLLRRLLGREETPLRLLERLTTRLGRAAVEPLLDEWLGTDEPRQDVAELLLSVSDDAAEVMSARIGGARPNEQRRMVMLFDRMERWPRNFSPMPLAGSTDAALRRDAVRCMLRREAFREPAMLLALDDEDERVLGLALGAAMKHATPALVPQLLRRVSDESLSEDVRALVVRALAATRSEEAMRWMVRASLRRSWIVGRARLRDASPMLVAAIEGMATHWSRSPETSVAISLAARSGNAELRAAVARVGAA
jgi:hypothetical protein